MLRDHPQHRSGTTHNIDPGDDIVLGTHGGCLRCLIGEWYVCHPECAETFSDQEERVAYMKLLAAVKSGDLERVIRHEARLAGFVRYNPACRAVQVLSCGQDAVVASFQLDASSPLLRYASALPAVTVRWGVGVVSGRHP